MATLYAGALLSAQAIQAKLRAARGYPCCACHTTPRADCPCTDHRRPDGTILPGPHSALSVAREAVDVRENPRTKGEYFVAVPASYEKDLTAQDKLTLTTKTLAQVTVDIAIEPVPVDEKLIEEPTETPIKI